MALSFDVNQFPPPVLQAEWEKFKQPVGAFPMRITKRTSIAIRVLMFCSANVGRLVTKAEIAKRCDLSESHLAQVINQLAQLGYLKTQRGRNGGIALARPKEAITVGGVFRQIEDNVPVTECYADADHSCTLVDMCSLKTALADAAEAFYAHLDKITLEALMCGNQALTTAFLPAECVKQA
jgi:Rrf2 family nitric oxide-sensitive transcriptional repressor